MIFIWVLGTNACVSASGGGGVDTVERREEVSSDSLWCIADYNLLVSDENIPKALIFMTNVILFYFR